MDLIKEIIRHINVSVIEIDFPDHELHDVFGISDSKLQKDFRNIVGMTLRQYLIHKKMELAQKILDENPQLSLNDLMVEINYNLTERSFRNHFKTTRTLSQDFNLNLITQEQSFTDLNHLSEQEVEKLIERYYSQEKIKDLLEDYSLDIKSGQLIRLFPPRITEHICPYCNENMIKRFASRTYSNYDDGDIICESCKHTHDFFGCRCQNCRNAERERKIIEHEEKFQAIKVILDKMNERRISSEELTLEEKIYLGALFRVGLSEDLSIINPVDSFYIPLAPTDNYSTEILENLSSRNIIGISPESDVDAFAEVDFVNNSIVYTNYRIKRTLLIDVKGGDKKSFIESLMNPTYELLPEDAYDLWLKIALNECLEYFYYSVRNVFGAEYNAGNKTLSVFTEMLKNLSVSQVFCLIYRATNTALRFQVERGVYRKYAVNTIIGNAQNFAERALNNNWSTTKYSRPRECPQSALSKFFFDRVLKIGDDGFNMPPMRLSSPLDDLNDQMPNF